MPGIEEKKISKNGPCSQDAHRSRASHIAIQCDEFLKRYKQKSTNSCDGTFEKDHEGDGI